MSNIFHSLSNPTLIIFLCIYIYIYIQTKIVLKYIRACACIYMYIIHSTYTEYTHYV